MANSKLRENSYFDKYLNNSTMKVLSLFVACSFSLMSTGQSYTSYFTGNTVNMIISPTPYGGLCMMGGASEHDEAMKWFLTHAYGGDVLVIRASGSDGYNDYMYTSLGISVNSVETIVFNNSSAAYDPYVLDRISKAEAIWMAGGDQWDYVSYWRNTPVDSLINEGIANRGLTIGGTSAGMAVLGDYYFSAENGTVTSTAALQNPFDTDITVDSTSFFDVPFLENVITDTHYDDPDRKGRHVVFLSHILQNYGVDAKGIACNEYTAVCIDENGIAHVFGDYPAYDEFAYFIAKNCELFYLSAFPEVYNSGTPLTWNYSGEILKAYKVPGTMNGTNTFDLNDWETGSGGEWLNWSVDAGTFIETASSAPSCSASTTELSEDGISIYPNPSEGAMMVEFTSSQNRSFRLLDLNGRIVWNTESELSSFSIDVSHLPAGIYHLNIVSGAETFHKRVIKN